MQHGAATWVEVAEAPPRVLLVPLGSCEQHGPHLPLATDTVIACAVADAVADRLDDVSVSPPVPYGASGEHESFAGTLSIGVEALIAVLVELGRSAFGGPGSVPYSSLVFVNGHGGNLAAVRTAVDRLVAEGRPASSWSPRVDGGDAHAGHTETSIMLALDAAAVRSARPVGVTDDLGDVMAELRRGGVGAVSPSGVLGDATGANAAAGARILAALVDDLAAHVSHATG